MRLPDPIDPERFSRWTALAESRLPALFDTGPDWIPHGAAFSAGLALALAAESDPAEMSRGDADRLLLTVVLRAAHAGFDVHRFLVPVPHLRRSGSPLHPRGDWVVDLDRLWRGEPVDFELRQHRLLLQIADRVAEAWARQPDHPGRILLSGLPGFAKGRGGARRRAARRRNLCDTFRNRLTDRLRESGLGPPEVCAADLAR